MEFLRTTVGDRARAYAPTQSLVAPFRFARPVRRVRALLEGFDLRYVQDDNHLREVQVRTTTELDDAVSGRVRVDLAWRDAQSPSGDLAGFFVALLLLGEPG